MRSTYARVNTVGRLTPKQRKFNLKFSALRCIVERAFGMPGFRTGHGKPGKSWNFSFQAWKVMEFNCWLWKGVERHGKL